MRWWIVALAVIGIVTSSLALHEHYRTDISPCSINDKWDCGLVNHSPYALYHGVPVATIGIFGYALLSVLAAFKARWFVLGAAIAGLGFSLYLTRIEAQILGVWCIYCVISLVIISLITLSSLGWVATTIFRRERN